MEDSRKHSKPIFILETKTTPPHSVAKGSPSISAGGMPPTPPSDDDLLAPADSGETYEAEGQDERARLKKLLEEKDELLEEQASNMLAYRALIDVLRTAIATLPDPLIHAPPVTFQSYAALRRYFIDQGMYKRSVHNMLLRTVSFCIPGESKNSEYSEYKEGAKFQQVVPSQRTKDRGVRLQMLPTGDMASFSLSEDAYGNQAKIWDPTMREASLWTAHDNCIQLAYYITAATPLSKKRILLTERSGALWLSSNDALLEAKPLDYLQADNLNLNLPPQALHDSDRVVFPTKSSTFNVLDLSVSPPQFETSLYDHSGTITALSVLTSGWLIVADEKGFLTLWDMRKRNKLAKQLYEKEKVPVKFKFIIPLADGGFITGDDASNVSIWHVSSAGKPTCARTFSTAEGGLFQKKFVFPITAMALLPNDLLVIAHNNGTVKIWDFKREKVVTVLSQGVSMEALEGAGPSYMPLAQQIDCITSFAVCNGQIIGATRFGEIHSWRCDLDSLTINIGLRDELYEEDIRLRHHKDGGLMITSHGKVGALHALSESISSVPVNRSALEALKEELQKFYPPHAEPKVSMTMARNPTTNRIWLWIKGEPKLSEETAREIMELCDKFGVLDTPLALRRKPKPQMDAKDAPALLPPASALPQATYSASSSLSYSPSALPSSASAKPAGMLLPKLPDSSQLRPPASNPGKNWASFHASGSPSPKKPERKQIEGVRGEGDEEGLHAEPGGVYPLLPSAPPPPIPSYSYGGGAEGETG